ncbi:hypothetical protein B0H11DRAFT_584623 [Mycena galericulata]|nr:hypothetical protein B0H11DRAFT_584623 [Mycena galericulata]
MAPHPINDYQKAAGNEFPSFHSRTGQTSSEATPREPANAFGFPQPGAQSPTAAQATARHYFVDNPTWDAILDHGQFDDIVCGTGFCALAYIDAALKLNPHRKILVLERGEFWLPEHFQNLPLPFRMLLGGPSETFPWQLSSRTFNSDIEFMRGSCPFFGGRSTFWSAWCPRPDAELMRNWPKSMKDTAANEEFWAKCTDLLHVVSADALHDPTYQTLQRYIDTALQNGIKDETIENADFTQAARLAVGRVTSLSTLVFDKFSTPGPLLRISERQRRLAEEGKGAPLTIATNVVVERFEVDPEDTLSRANVLHTSRGALCFPRSATNIILATGAIPAATIVMNSIGDQQKDRAGTRLSGHFLSHVAARFPIPEKVRKQSKVLDHLEIGASYLAGKDPANGLQYHVQITAIHSPNPEKDAEDAGRLCPDYAAAATEAQLKGSEEHIVLVCAALGELDEGNSHSWVRHNPANPDVTTNIRVQVVLSEKDQSLRQVMHTATYQAIAAMAENQKDQLEYWHEAQEGREGHWETSMPSDAAIQVPGIVHETSTLYMSDDLEADPGASVDREYRLKGCRNVYVTGGALFPTSGSWNRTCCLVGVIA